jgi:2-succinyl-5-enolpyruvyl-6-hydroxy-3-cyclohexene-1-carboxylate synthase
METGTHARRLETGPAGNRAVNPGPPLPTNRNDFWCRRIISACHSIGMRHAVLCPGNRNTPLLRACLENGIHCISALDERVAGFIGLGLARASRTPVAVVVTSGTAAANLLPACCEAYATGIPLILITADRPWLLQGTGAPQTMPQQGLFHAHTTAEASLAEVQAGAANWAALDAQLGSTLPALQRGPIHVNVPLDEPLDATPEDDWQDPPTPHPAVGLPARQRTVDLPAALSSILQAGQRGVIIAGSDCPLGPDAVALLAQRSGYPVLADAMSGSRHPDVSNLILDADLVCAASLAPADCELLIRLGEAPVARATWEWAAAQTCPVLRISRFPVARDFLHEFYTNLIDPTPTVVGEISDLLAQAPADWTAAWLRADTAVATAKQRAIAAAPWSELSAIQLIARHHGHRHLLAGNSLPVRTLNHCLPADDVPVFSNRGVCGIDGQVATLLGIGHCLKGRGMAVIGDVSGVHDLGGLAACARLGADCTVVIIDNGGGRIFDLVARDDLALDPWLRTDPAIDWPAVAGALGFVVHACGDADSLRQALETTAGASGPALIHVRCDGATTGEALGAWRQFLHP